MQAESGVPAGKAPVGRAEIVYDTVIPDQKADSSGQCSHFVANLVRPHLHNGFMRQNHLEIEPILNWCGREVKTLVSNAVGWIQTRLSIDNVLPLDLGQLPGELHSATPGRREEMKVVETRGFVINNAGDRKIAE